MHRSCPGISGPGSGRPPVQAAFRQGCKLLVRLFLLIERLLEQRNAVIAADLFRPRDERAVAKSFRSARRLAPQRWRCVQDRFVVDLSGNVFRFINDFIDGRAIDPFGLFSEVLEHLFQPLHIIFGLLQVALEARA